MKANSDVQFSTAIRAPEKQITRWYFEQHKQFCQIHFHHHYQVPAAALAREQIQSGRGRRIITISRDLAETPVVPALRGGVRIERHGAGDLPRLLLPAMAPRPGLVGRRDHSAPTWSSGWGIGERRRRRGSGAEAGPGREIAASECGKGEATRRKSLSGFSKSRRGRRPPPAYVITGLPRCCFGDWK